MTRKLILTLWLFCIALLGKAQTTDPQAYYNDEKEGAQQSQSITDGQAPLEVQFKANPDELGSWEASYEWHFYVLNKDNSRTELFVRYEEDTQYTFTESGTYNIELKTNLRDGDNTMEVESPVITITIGSSRLVFPNAFSPNDDGVNDKYGAMGVNDANSPNHWKNIVSFKAIILNRWGQKLYEWNDPAGYWDGKYKGHDVNEGTYFVMVKAKGSDGREYNIRKDVNLIRGYNKDGKTNN
jgi:gliding motility-associated-like protein